MLSDIIVQCEMMISHQEADLMCPLDQDFGTQDGFISCRLPPYYFDSNWNQIKILNWIKFTLKQDIQRFNFFLNKNLENDYIQPTLQKEKLNKKEVKFKKRALRVTHPRKKNNFFKFEF